MNKRKHTFDLNEPPIADCHHESIESSEELSASHGSMHAGVGVVDYFNDQRRFITNLELRHCRRSDASRERNAPSNTTRQTQEHTMTDSYHQFVPPSPLDFIQDTASNISTFPVGCSSSTQRDHADAQNSRATRTWSPCFKHAARGQSNLTMIPTPCSRNRIRTATPHVSVPECPAVVESPNLQCSKVPPTKEPKMLDQFTIPVGCRSSTQERHSDPEIDHAVRNLFELMKAATRGESSRKVPTPCAGTLAGQTHPAKVDGPKIKLPVKDTPNEAPLNQASGPNLQKKGLNTSTHRPTKQISLGTGTVLASGGPPAVVGPKLKSSGAPSSKESWTTDYITCSIHADTCKVPVGTRCQLCSIDLAYVPRLSKPSKRGIVVPVVMPCMHCYHIDCLEEVGIFPESCKDPPCPVCP